MGENISEKLELSYEECWTENDGGVYGCGCEHRTIAEAVACMARDGKSFVRAVQGGTSRSLSDEEFPEFLSALGKSSERTPP